MACRLFSANLLPEPMMTYCQMYHQKQTSAKFEIKYNFCIQYIYLKLSPTKRHFVQASVHCDDVTWVPLRLKSLPTRQLNCLLGVTTTKTYYSSSVNGIHRGDQSAKRKAFPCRDVTMVSISKTYVYYHQTSNISRTLVGNKIVNHSDVVGASPVGAAPTTSSFSTEHLASVDKAKTTERPNEKQLSFWIWCGLY